LLQVHHGKFYLSIIYIPFIIEIMKSDKAKAYLIILLYLFCGLIIMGSVSLLRFPSFLNSSCILILFIVVNIFTARLLHLGTAMRTFCSLRKLHFLPAGVLFGIFIGVFPALIAIASEKIAVQEITFTRSFSVYSIVVTLIIVAWEELWFRGIFLNHCQRYLSEINISVTIGFLFMLVHILNPDINLTRTGPTLFFAGLFLTLVYFYFRTIWLPIGLHFGNNLMVMESRISEDVLIGNEGYLSAVILACFSRLFIRLIHTKNKAKNVL
jgi:membrane protease YdiL (CAAX protease family)